MPSQTERTSDLRAALTSARTPFTVTQYRSKQVIFSQGDPSDSVMYIEDGRIRLTVLTPSGQEAIIGLLERDAFLGEEALAGAGGRQETATAMSATTVLVIAKSEMLERLRTQRALSERFIAHMVARNTRLEADLTDQLVSSCEKRVARTLLLLAGYGDRVRTQRVAPPVSQEVIAGMVGTTRSRVNVFMNKFKRMGFIEYDHGLKINPSLLTVVVHD